MLDISLTANYTGGLALFASIIAILPTIIIISKFPAHLKKSILQTARYGLYCAICLGLIHGLLMTQQDNIDFYNINTYWVYAGGLFAFNLLALIAFMYAELKSNLVLFNYLKGGALILLIFHVAQRL